MNKNLENAERVIGEKSDEARLALYGSSLGVLGGGVEVVGLALKHGATQVQKARLSARGAEAGKATVRIGSFLARSGATIAAAAGLYDAKQAWLATQRTRISGDTYAGTGYAISTALSTAAAGAGILAAASGTTALLGPLGIAILLGLAGYAFFKWAEANESSPLDRWARRCFFGIHNENPPVHWGKPEHAQIAIAELNAATLGVEVSVSFKLKHYSSSVPQAGYSIASGGIPTAQLFLEYRIALPHFDADRSAYCWTLKVHRREDQSASDYSGGEVVTGGSLNRSTQTFVAPTRQNSSDRRPLTTHPKTDFRVVQLTNNNTMQIKDIKGSAAIPEDTTPHNIEAATLSLTYWPNRDIQDAYAALTLMDKA
ncbi:hypothetical protein D3C77_366220 [compost metagenome]